MTMIAKGKLSKISADNLFKKLGQNVWDAAMFPYSVSACPHGHAFMHSHSL